MTAVPYFALYARDLSQNGYRYRDVLKVYALNLLLLPANLAGVLKSLEQGFTKRKIPFARTPKIDGRTVAPARYLVAILGLIGLWSLGAGSDLLGGRTVLGLFALANVLVLAYGVGAFIGWTSLASDLKAQWLGRLGRRRSSRAIFASKDPSFLGNDG
jgi:cellulose synthase (UDP-forming)